MILFCFQDDLQGTVSSVLYTEKWLTRDSAAGKDGFQVRVSGFKARDLRFITCAALDWLSLTFRCKCEPGHLVCVCACVCQGHGGDAERENLGTFVSHVGHL